MIVPITTITTTETPSQGTSVEDAVFLRDAQEPPDDNFTQEDEEFHLFLLLEQKTKFTNPELMIANMLVIYRYRPRHGLGAHGQGITTLLKATRGLHKMGSGVQIGGRQLHQMEASIPHISQSFIRASQNDEGPPNKPPNFKLLKDKSIISYLEGILLELKEFGFSVQNIKPLITNTRSWEEYNESDQ